MFKKPIYILPIIILLFLIIILSYEKPRAKKEFTLTPFFQILGKFVQTADVVLSRMLARGEWDESKFGIELKKEFNDEYPETIDSIYLNELADDLLKNSRKDFDYQIYVDPYMAPNAFAMPGGVIVFSAELLELLENEAQVASILAHEIAHVELDHCINSFKFELAKEEYDWNVPGVFSLLYNVLIGLSFSKTQEDEADDYAFNLIVRNTDYWPYALSESFQLFIDEYGKDENRIVLSEFFQSHPDMAYRRDKYYEKTKSLNLYGQKYLGKINLEGREVKSFYDLDEEWKDLP